MTQDPSPRNRSRQDGYSVLELLGVVAITASLSGVALVQTQGAMRTYRVQEASNSLSAKIADARMNALKRNRPVWVQIDEEAGTMQVQMTDAGGNVVDIGPPVRLSRGVAFAGQVPTQVIFDALGMMAPTGCPSAAACIGLQDTSGNARTVAVSLSGAVTTTYGLTPTTTTDWGGGGTGTTVGTSPGGTGTTGGTTTGETGTVIDTTVGNTNTDINTTPVITTPSGY